MKHLGDADLIRFIDNEGDAREQAAWSQHVETCSECRNGVALLRRDALRVREALARAALEADVKVVPLPVRAAREARGWRVAAILIALAAPVAAIPVVRALLPDAEPVAESVDPVVVPEAPRTVIRFEPDAGELQLVFDAVPSSGVLQVTYAVGTEATLEIEAADVLPVISAAHVRVQNSPDARSNVWLHVPASVTAVVVRVGDRDAVVVDRAGIRAGMSVGLGEG